MIKNINSFNSWLLYSFKLWTLNLKPYIMNDIYVCDVCGYEYDPAAGDPDNGIAPGTPFEAIPDSWTCPLCGVDKTEFSKA